ncbi:MAG: hypothetical protein AAB410_02375 [Patescibacteria group bacterium]
MFFDDEPVDGGTDGGAVPAPSAPADEAETTSTSDSTSGEAM